MARIWPVSEGREHTPPFPWAELPLSEAIKLCDLRQSDLVSSLAKPPRFAEPHLDRWYAGYKHVVVEVEEDEARKSKWTSGFYKSRLAPREVFRRLIQESLVAALGGENVVRVEVARGVDSQGRGAIHITVVISPDAIQNLPSGATLDVLVRVRELLHEMHVGSTPIVSYATEAELAEDVGS
jgi:hypothetical protein